MPAAMQSLTIRPRRLRATASIRSLVAQTTLAVDQLIQPYFVAERDVDREPIEGFTGIHRWGIDALTDEIATDLVHGVRHFLLFGSSPERDERGSAASAADSRVAQAVRRLRERLGDAPTLFTDVCLCSYTSHGHCGVVKGAQVDNDATLSRLAAVACAHAAAGADFVAPSDMMDGRVGAIRTALDDAGFANVGILAYTAKYASAYYGPFRNALDSSPEGFDRAGYQMDFRNRREALRELDLDLDEGADLVMVKPALAYLDVVADLAAASDVPVCAYSVSGEYEMVKQMARVGLADERALAIENLTAIRRAGAQAILTYFASTIARERWL
ncbi:MAG: porphobilinogen synthase [Burkholderiales bacterium]|nr:porphobilinogen synthase [Burkholderiales bacterium]